MTVARGVVRHGHPMLALTLVTPTGERVDVQAMIDTGFRDSLMLPRATFDRVRRSSPVATTTTLADERSASHRQALVEVDFCGERKEVYAGDLSEETFVGMDLLEGYRLTIDVGEGGAVTIAPLPR